MTEEEILEALAQGEGSHVEFKSDLSKESIRGAADALAAMATEVRTGTVIFGVEDDGRPLGVERADEKRQTVVNSLSQMIEPKTALWVEWGQAQGKDLLIAKVEARHPVYQSRGVYLKRVGSQNIRLSTEELMARLEKQPQEIVPGIYRDSYSGYCPKCGSVVGQAVSLVIGGPPGEPVCHNCGAKMVVRRT